MKNVAVLTEDGAFAVFFAVFPPPGICHTVPIPGGQPGVAGWGARRR